eukprot:scpid94972/ scgid35547/ 
METSGGSVRINDHWGQCRAEMADVQEAGFAVQPVEGKEHSIHVRIVKGVVHGVYSGLDPTRLASTELKSACGPRQTAQGPQSLQGSWMALPSILRTVSTMPMALWA